MIMNGEIKKILDKGLTNGVGCGRMGEEVVGKWQLFLNNLK